MKRKIITFVIFVCIVAVAAAIGGSQFFIKLDKPLTDDTQKNVTKSKELLLQAKKIEAGTNKLIKEEILFTEEVSSLLDTMHF